MEIIKGLSQKANKTQEAWIEPTLLNSWVNNGAPARTCAYMKDEFGFVCFKGMIKNGSSLGAIMFVLPAEYRPSSGDVYLVATSNDAYAELIVHANGNVGANRGSTIWFSLEGLRFKAGV